MLCLTLAHTRTHAHVRIDIVDKTADFVARNGTKFEDRIRETEKSNPKFSFLQPTDPYHAYYQLRIREVQEGGKGTPSPPPFFAVPHTSPSLCDPPLFPARLHVANAGLCRHRQEGRGRGGRRRRWRGHRGGRSSGGQGGGTGGAAAL
jgi:hypothetical protein